MRNPRITSEKVYSVTSNMVFNQHKIRVAKSGNIKIEIEPGDRHLGGWRRPIEYTIGYTPGIGYWLRRRGVSGSTFPLHYNRSTHEYGFNTFEEAASHLEKLFINKYFYIMPVMY